MKIFRALFSRKKQTPAPAPAQAPVQKPAPVAPYDHLLQKIRTTESADFLRQLAAHPSGYMREAVLERIAELALPELLPAVLDRLNDWVPQVQRVARTALMKLLPLLPTVQLLAAMPVILRLHSAGRADYAEWLEQFELTLIQTATIDDICEGARGPNIKVARACVHVLDKHRLLDAPALIALISERNDDIVLARRALELCSGLTLELQSAFYRSAARSHFGAIRAISIRMLLNMESEPREELAIAALLEVQPSVRYVAVNYLLATGFDVRMHYQKLLQQGPQSAQRVRICLAELAALRNPADIELVKSYQSSQYPSVRMAARAAWFKLAEKDKDAIALVAMSDTAKGPRKFAAQLVHRQGAYIAFATIRAGLETSTDVAFYLRLAETNKWNWLECLARAGLQRGADQALQLGLDYALGTWLNSNAWYAHPDKEQLAFLTSAPVATFFSQLLAARPQRLQALNSVLYQAAS